MSGVPSSGGPNWLGLLQWSLANTDGTSPNPNVQRMGEEDRKWLEAVMKDNVKDEPARMNQIMVEIVGMLDTSTCAENEERIEIMLEELRDMTEQIDMAQIFVRFGGLTCLIGILESKEPLSLDLRCLSVGVIGTLSQNNIIVQEIIYHKGVVDKLSTVSLTNESFVLSAKVIYAISCIIRNYPIAEVYFGLTYGQTVFRRAISSGIPSLATRAVFLSNALITSDSSSEDMIAAILPALIPGCFRYVFCSDIDLREGTLRLLVSLAKTTSGKVLLSSAGAVEAALQERASAIIADPDYAEQEEHEQRLITEFRQALAAPACLPTSVFPVVNTRALNAMSLAQSEGDVSQEEKEEDVNSPPLMLLAGEAPPEAGMQ